MLFVVPGNMRQVFFMTTARSRWKLIELGEVVEEPILPI
jgi:hypothetical protein